MGQWAESNMTLYFEVRQMAVHVRRQTPIYSVLCLVQFENAIAIVIVDFCLLTNSFSVSRIFTARRYAKRGICLRRRVSVCVCVCLSHSGIVHSGIVSKRQNVGSRK